MFLLKLLNDLKSKFRSCSRRARDGSIYCGRHQKKSEYIHLFSSIDDPSALPLFQPGGRYSRQGTTKCRILKQVHARRINKPFVLQDDSADLSSTQRNLMNSFSNISKECGSDDLDTQAGPIVIASIDSVMPSCKIGTSTPHSEISPDLSLISDKNFIPPPQPPTPRVVTVLSAANEPLPAVAGFQPFPQSLQTSHVPPVKRPRIVSIKEPLQVQPKKGFTEYKSNNNDEKNQKGNGRCI